ncbi:MAG: transposase, partial [Ignavibacteriae bacterium]|nr:transposase [Ignavibacteriota bacterium]
MRHKDSQRRMSTDGRAVFVTTATYERYPYFHNEILSELFVHDLYFTAEIKEVELYGYAVLPDHAHLLFRPIHEVCYSEVVRSLKTNFSRNANDIVMDRLHRPAITAGDVTSRRLQRYEKYLRETLPRLRQKLIETYGEIHCIPRFRWQKSFRDHIIRSEEDFHKHLNYIYGNAVKHELASEPEDWKWMWVMGMDEPTS